METKIKLKFILKEREKTIKWLSNNTNIKYNVLTNLAKNGVGSVSIENIEKICEVLKITVNDLLETSEIS